MLNYMSRNEKRENFVFTLDRAVKNYHRSSKDDIKYVMTHGEMPMTNLHSWSYMYGTSSWKNDVTVIPVI
jgi:hypothetical protein